MIESWSDYEPANAEEVVGLALIAAGYFLDTEGPGVLMDRQAAAEIVAALRGAGYLAPPTPCTDVQRVSGSVGDSTGIARCELEADHIGDHRGRLRDWMSKPTGDPISWAAA